MAARLKEKYHKQIKQALQKELGLENPMAVPRLDKIVINMGLGEATQNTSCWTRWWPIWRRLPGRSR